MQFDLLFAEPSPVPTHAMAAFLAIVLGGLQFVLPKGTVLHRGLGYLWVTAMGYVAISSFFIHEIQLWGPFSPIHILSVLTLGLLAFSIWLARSGRIKAHKGVMIYTYVSALIVTGGFTLLPGRVINAVFWGG